MMVLKSWVMRDIPASPEAFIISATTPEHPAALPSLIPDRAVVTDFTVISGALPGIGGSQTKWSAFQGNSTLRSFS